MTPHTKVLQNSDPRLLISFFVKSAPGRIRTCDLRIRSPALYPAELRALARFLRFYRPRFLPFFLPLGGLLNRDWALEGYSDNAETGAVMPLITDSIKSFFVSGV